VPGSAPQPEVPNYPPDEGAAPDEDTEKDNQAKFMDVVEMVTNRDDITSYAKTVFGCIDKNMPIRRACIMILDWPWFDRIIMLLILINSIMMAAFANPIMNHQLEELKEVANATVGCGPGADQSALHDYKTQQEGPLTAVDMVFLTFFTIELLIKVIAMGFIFERHSYLRNGWNWLDFIVVISGLIEAMSGADGGAVTVLRLFRLLRPLRALNRVRGMRVLVNCILQAMPQMCRVFMVLILLMLVLGIVGVQLFANSLRTQCFYEPEPGAGFTEPTGYICDPRCSDKWDSKTQQLLEGKTCDSFGANTLQERNSQYPNTWTCDVGQQCLCGETGADDPYCQWIDNPNYGINSFDNILSAMMTIFQSITLEGWVDVMYFLQDGTSPVLGTVFQIVLVLLGALIVMNLFLAVLADNFRMADSEIPEEPDEENEEEAVSKAAEGIRHKSKFRQWCLEMITDRRFDLTITGCILANTVIMCIDFYPPTPDKFCDDCAMTQYKPPALFWTLFALNTILTVIFTIETCMKLLGYGTRIFVKDSFNIFDAVVVVVSLIEIVLELLNQTKTADTTGFPALSVLRALRVFRILKMVRTVDSLKSIMSALVRSLKSVVYLVALLGLFIFIFALLGMEFFGGFTPYPVRWANFTEDQFPCTWSKWEISWGDPLPPRANFDYIGSAFLSIFIVLSGENWNEIYFDQHRATWAYWGPIASVYFLILFVLGNLILFNLFIAILISNMEEGDDDGGQSSKADASAENNMSQRVYEYTFGVYVDRTSYPDSPPLQTSSTNRQFNTEAVPVEQNKLKRQSTHSLVEVDGSMDKSLCLFSWSGAVRRHCATIVWHPFFDQVVFVLILVSSCLLGMDWPGWNDDLTVKKVLAACDYIFTALFTIECILKIITYGFLHSHDKRFPAYLRVGWNVLDFTVVLISWFSIIAKVANLDLELDFLRAIRAARAFRPLRLIARMETMRVVVSTLLGAIPAVGVFALVLVLFLIIFAILFMQMFGGKLGYCMDPAPELAGVPFSQDNYDLYGSRIIPGYNKTIKQDDYAECMALPRYNLTRFNTVGVPLTDPRFSDPSSDDYWGENGYNTFTEFPQWLNPDFGHFDHLAAAVLLLLEVACLEGWPDVMFRVMDTDLNYNYINYYWLPAEQDPNQLFGQLHTPNIYMGATFCVIWIILGCFVLLNMVIGVVLDSYNQMKQENDGLTMMTEEQADWVMAQKSIIAMRPLKQPSAPKEQWRMPIFQLVSSNAFDIFIMCIIFLNMFFMCITTWNPSKYSDDIKILANITNIANIIFFVLYTIEMFLKWIGLGLRQYFKDVWNQFDFVLVVLSAIDIALSSSDIDVPVPPALLRVVRLFRVVRILRILKTAKQIRTIITTIRISIPNLQNLSVLLLIVLYIFAVFCMNLFWQVNYTPGDIKPFGGAEAPFYSEMYTNGTMGPYQADTFYAVNQNSNEGDFINRNANFRTLPNSLLLLFRCATGESFNGVMHDAMDYHWGSNRLHCCPTCGPVVNDETSSSCGPHGGFWSILIMQLFTFIMGFIILNGLFIGVIVDNFTNIGSENKDITVEAIEEFREVWLKFDPKGSFIVRSHSLLIILQKLPPPLGIMGLRKTRAEMLQLLGVLDIPDHEGYLHFMEVLTALSHAVCGVPLPVCDTTKRLQKSVARTPALSKLEKPLHNALTNYLVSLLQSRWRGYAMRKKYADVGEDDPILEGAVAAPPQVKYNQVAPAPPS